MRASSRASPVFDEFERQVAQPWRRDRERLRHRLRIDAQDRHGTHASAAASAAPDLVAGRGGLLDLHALRWLEPEQDERLIGPVPSARVHALDFLLGLLAAVEELGGQVPDRLLPRLQDRLATALYPGKTRADLLAELYAHARWVAFSLDGVLAPSRDDRQLGTSLALRRGELVAERLPPIERAPSLGLRVANLVGLAPPDAALLAWATEPGPPIRWDETTLDQFWLLLRAADWRAWDFLDVTGLLVRYVPELAAIWRRCGPAASTDDLALDSHSFHALRALHAWTESADPLAGRVLRPLRRRDLLYLAVLLHGLTPEAATAAARPARVCPMTPARR